MASQDLVKLRPKCPHGYFYSGDSASYVCHQCAVREIERLEARVEELLDEIKERNEYEDYKEASQS